MKQIVFAQFSCNCGLHFALDYLPISKPTAGGQVIRPGRASNLAPQAADPIHGAEPFRSTRREPRSSTELTFVACGLAASGRFFVEVCSVVNISRSGCCLRLHTRPQTNSALALRAVPGGASLPDGTTQLLLQLAWLRPEDDGWLIGAFTLGDVDLGRLAFPSRTP